MTVVIVAVLVLTAVLATLWMRTGQRWDPASQVSPFEAARAVTRRWSEDPDATPAPLRNYPPDQRTREERPDDGDEPA